MRINQFLARCGVASRRGAEELVLTGRVRVNGSLIKDLTYQVNEEVDLVLVDGKKVFFQNQKRYLMLNKPVGYTTTVFDRHASQSVMSLVPDVPGLVPIGRLDRDSEGLLLFSNDGDFVYRMSHPRFDVEKVYEVTVNGHVGEQSIKRLNEPMVLKEGVALAQVRWLGENKEGTILEFRLHQGMNRQIRRMCGHVGLRVVRLVRTQIGEHRLGTLKVGGTKEITQ